MQRTIVLSLGLTLGLSATPAGAQPQAPKQGQKLALLVGVKGYSHTKLSPLRYSENDVTRLADELRKAGYQVTLLCDTVGSTDPTMAPTKANIEKQLAQVLGKCRDRHDTLLLAFAGHGLQFEDQKDAFFCPADAKPFADETKTMVSMGQVYKDLDRSYAGVKVLLVDACRNDPKIGKGARSGIDGDNAPRPPRGIAVLFSCAAGEVAYENDKLKHGVFFHFVLEGLRGAARKGDGVITFHSLADYVADGVAHAVPVLYKDEGAQQSPNMKADLVGASPVLLAARLTVPQMKVPPQALALDGGKARVENALDLDRDEMEPGHKAYKKYTFQAEAGATYTIDLHSTAFDAFLVLQDGAGKEIAKNDDAGNGSDSRIVSKLEKGGTYQILAMSKKGGGKGAFTLSIARAMVAAPPAKDRRLVFTAGQPTQVQDQLTEKDDVDAEGKRFKAYLFQAEAGKSYQFVLTGKDGVNPVLHIDDASGNVVQKEDYGNNEARISRLIFTAPTPGVYRAVATTLDAGKIGAFNLVAAPIQVFPAKVVALPLTGGKGTATGTLSTQDGIDKQGRYYTVYTFQAEAGKSYRVEMTGQNGLDPYVRITGEDDQLIKDEEAAGEGKLSRLVFTPAKNGTFRAVASAYQAGATGSYTLTVVPDTAVVAKPAVSGTFKLANGQSTVHDAIGSQDAKDGADKYFKAYQFSGEAGKTYRFEMTGKNGLDPFVRIETLEGKLLHLEDGGDGTVSRVLFKPAQSGVFRVVATTFNAGTIGDFTLTATLETNAAPAAPALPADKGTPYKLANGLSTVNDALTGKDVTDGAGLFFKGYPFHAQPGKTYRFEMTGKNGLKPYLRIEDEDGDNLRNEDEGDDTVSRIFFSSAKGGTFRLVATTYKSRMIGGFTLTAAEVAGVSLPVASVPMPPAGAATPFKLASGLATFEDRLTDEETADGAGRFFKGYSFTAQAGTAYHFEMTGKNGFAPLLRVETVDGKLLQEDKYDGKVARLSFTPGQSGTYCIITAGYNKGAVGSYTLSATQGGSSASTAAPVVPKGEPKAMVPFKLYNGQSSFKSQLTNIDLTDKTGRHYKVYTFTAEAGQSYRFEMFGSNGLDPQLRIEDAQGQVLKKEDHADGKVSRIVFTAGQSGTYRLVASTYEDGMVGNFSLSASHSGGDGKIAPADGN